MSDVDLAALSGSELRGLLGSARERGNAALAYEILKEMAARREAPPGGRRPRPRQGGEPRIVSVDLSDPAEPTDELPPTPSWRPPEIEGRPDRLAVPADRPELVAKSPARRSRRANGRAAPSPVLLPPLTAEDLEILPEPAMARPVRADPEPDLALGEPGLTLDSRPAPRRRRFTGVAALALSAVLGAAGGLGAGWFLRGTNGEPPSAFASPRAARALTIASEQQPATPAAAGASPASLTSAPAPPAAQADASSVQADREPAPPLTMDAALPSSPPPPAARDDEAVSKTPASQVAADHTPVSAQNACSNEPTPADRTICGDPRLQRLQRELRLAYAEALEAHQDKALLRERQLAWRDSRNGIEDRERLAYAYAERIQKLKAATADARRK